MTVETEVANLTTAVDNLASAVNVKKATLDASVADAQSAQSAAASSATTASGHATSAAASAAAAAATATGIAGFDLDAIAASKAVTAVDVFVYDTSKDSDGGAWRKRTQHTSWYNETLNTATRGSRREFPAVAVIVAEATKVTIYDGDDPSLPMWMVFNGGPYAYCYAAGGSPAATVSSVSIKNSLFVIGQNGNLAASVSVTSFISDENFQSRSGHHVALPISGRNNTDANNRIAETKIGDIVNGLVNDVAMTVLPDAPIDPATGLPVPTIAVATAGGISVITDSGAVYDSTSTSAHTQVDFSGKYLFYSNAVSGTFTEIVDASNINADGWTASKQYGFSQPPFLTGSSSFSSGGFIEPLSETSFVQKATTNKGISIVGVIDYGTPTVSSVAEDIAAYVTSTYNTGWMSGDIKGAFLSDTDTASLVGSGELVTNGTFDTDVSGWSVLFGSVSWSSGKLLLTEDGADGASARAYQGITTEVGKVYRVTADVGSVSFGSALIVASTDTNTGGFPTVLSAGNETVELFFVAAATTTNIIVSVQGTSARTAEFDNISVKLADADRSVNNKGLIVNGTVTRSAVATGAELVAYSGFSASNYLEQPYNSALDFGTGDFCVMGWISMGSTGAIRPVFSKGPLGSNPSPYFEFQTNGDNSLNWVGDNGASKVTTPILPTGIYSHVAFVRASGTGYLYVNGELVDSAANTDNYNHSNTDILRFGFRHDGLTNTFNGSLALLRISATAPTAEQIKKIYEDEKVLFQENAAATLYGASDAVTALAHDSDTGLLHVGTSAGRSVFQGLRRVSNTTTAVGTAISASNGLVVEE